MDWTSPDDLAAQIERLWQRGRMLSARLEGADLYPLRLRLKRPGRAELGQRFHEVRTWIAALIAGSRERRGFGYEIVWNEIDHRQLGRNRLPAAIVVPTEEDALALIGRQDLAVTFDRLARETLASFPSLQGWLIRKPLTVVANAGEWRRILAVLAWFETHPCSDLYLRQLDIPGIDTKFIELRRGLLTELLEQIQPREGAWERAPPSFEQRFGLRSRPALIRFRILDPELFLNGLSDITVPVEQLAMLDLPVRRVFITENEINGLAFPETPGSIVLFKLGYALDLLSSVTWLGDREILYWGDIDTHGFAMLSRLRARFPHTRSLLMDRKTLMAHRRLWSHETTPHAGALAHLNDEEQALYDELKEDGLGQGVRLEQERISFSWFQRALSSGNIQQSAASATGSPVPQPHDQKA
jgi:hypothetical protein